VRVLNWPLLLLTSVYLLSVTEVVFFSVTNFFYANASEGEILKHVRRRHLTFFAGLHFENYPGLTELDAAEDRQKCI